MKIYYFYAPINELFPDRKVDRKEVYAITNDKEMKKQFLLERADFFSCQVDEVDKDEWNDMKKTTAVAEKLLGYHKMFTFSHDINDIDHHKIKETPVLCTYAESMTLKESMESVFSTSPFNIVTQIPGSIFTKEIKKDLCRLQLPSIIRAKYSNDTIGLTIDDFNLTPCLMDTAGLDDWDVIQPEVSVDEMMLFLVMYQHLFK